MFHCSFEKVAPLMMLSQKIYPEVKSLEEEKWSPTSKRINTLCIPHAVVL